ncbi:conserved Plasmodium protein, unknown function [Plasmodium berghei]|uniref:Uncharacterized protein n=2 Tax=Plasmodium berghei TaxID=5821 RepID=A0A509ASN5_PLABA|nr:conserved Plasmodium protein, unknown function [Plasmodium berghei ANKA]CXJ25332.1 conserved Plasmodium protein, unknown function [Plasmodium berghei]SCM26857.1 conserved Plasmodium protein, unknown function [Plasmodium berghei]SCN28671.1 conserved Plasmodium protein, unknown function [Plasmodium berghei]SCO62894.1 conserved Plasmodium protein, unknown function [Plasmodium berghei]SCO64419.1 conserved Plasmodium protein, unknown function [Plasmodium berghei]|eukprot:XP_034424316.1 conserved Plasmodium protein, unknown function [Plasmodium berghei ANKA]
MITSLDIVHELLTTIYYKIFSRKRNEIVKYDILLFIDDFYYFDILNQISRDINELDNKCEIIENKDFNEIFTNFCKNRNYIINNKIYFSDNEKRIDFLHEICSDLLCLIYENSKNGKSSKYNKNRNISKCLNNKCKESKNLEKINKNLIEISNLTNYPNNSINYMNKNDIKNILDSKKIKFKNNDIIITEKINQEKENLLTKAIEKYNSEYELRYYYLFLNNMLTIQTMFTSPLVNIYSKEIQNIIKKIIEVKNNIYIPITIYDILSFQYEQIIFNKSSYNNLTTPVKKIKIVDDVIERGGIPTEYSKKEITKNLINANMALKDKSSKSRKQNESGFSNKYRVNNYYNSRRY